MNWKHISYSVSIGIAVTALSFVLYNQSCALLIWPGIFMELMINSLMLFIIHSDDWYSLPSGAYLALNTTFYSFVVLIIQLVITRLRLLQLPPRA